MCFSYRKTPFYDISRAPTSPPETNSHTSHTSNQLSIHISDNEYKLNDYLGQNYSSCRGNWNRSAEDDRLKLMRSLMTSGHITNFYSNLVKRYLPICAITRSHRTNNRSEKPGLSNDISTITRFSLKINDHCLILFPAVCKAIKLN